MDLVLSAGFLAFARQAGFLAAIEEARVRVDGICGVSSGALAGALWSAGHPAARVAEILSESAPLRHVRPNWRFWRGAFDLDPMIRTLRTLLPARFEDLDRPFAVGVMDRARTAHLLSSGPLPEAVAASCAVPGLFAPVLVDGVEWRDGGFADRTFLGAWRWRRPEKPVLLHLVEARNRATVLPDLPHVTIVHSARSGARLWNLGDFAGQLRETRDRALAAISSLGT